MEALPFQIPSDNAALSGLDPPTRQAVLTHAMAVSLPAGTVLFKPGELCTQFAILLSGSLRVYRIARSGREMLLYRVHGGETCIMTTACMLASDAYAAGGTVESDVRALVLSVRQFNELIEQSPSFRGLVFHGFAARIMDLMQRIEELNDLPVEVRLAGRLMALRGANPVVPVTHQELACDVGTAREVVSRTLERLESMGVLRLSRGHVEIIDQDLLGEIADQR